jgi:hypothetical protein
MNIYKKVKEHKLPYTEEESKDWSFNDLSRALMNKTLITDYKALLSTKMNITIKTRKVLSAFMIAWFSDIIMDNIPDTDVTKKSLIQISRIILRELRKILDAEEPLSYFPQCIKMYNDLFQIWIKKDKKVLKDDLVKKFKEFQMTYALLNTPKFEGEKHKDYAIKWKKDIDFVKGKIVKQLEKLGDCEAEIKKCEEMEKYEELKTIDVDKIMSDTASELYWTKLEKELASKPPNWTTFVKILAEIKTRFIAIQPKMTNTYSSLIDMKQITHLTTNQVMDKKELGKVFKNVITCFMETQSASQDDELKQWESEVSERFNSPDMIWYKFVPVLLNKILIRLEKLEEYVVAVRAKLNNLKK